MKRILNRKLFLFVASLLLSSLSFVACNPDKDDEDNSTPTYKELIIGKWDVYKTCREDFVDGELETSTTATYESTGDFYTFTFTNNGKVIIKEGVGYLDTMSYSIDNNSLAVGKDGYYQIFTIKALTPSSLNMFTEDNYGDGNTERMSFYLNRDVLTKK